MTVNVETRWAPGSACAQAEWILMVGGRYESGGYECELGAPLCHC